jgi:hypothetical protein
LRVRRIGDVRAVDESHGDDEVFQDCGHVCLFLTVLPVGPVAKPGFPPSIQSENG